MAARLKTVKVSEQPPTPPTPPGPSDREVRMRCLEAALNSSSGVKRLMGPLDLARAFEDYVKTGKVPAPPS